MWGKQRPIHTCRYFQLYDKNLFREKCKIKFCLSKSYNSTRALACLHPVHQALNMLSIPLIRHRHRETKRVWEKQRKKRKTSEKKKEGRALKRANDNDGSGTDTRRPPRSCVVLSISHCCGGEESTSCLATHEKFNSAFLKILFLSQLSLWKWRATTVQPRRLKR